MSENLYNNATLKKPTQCLDTNISTVCYFGNTKLDCSVYITNGEASCSNCKTAFQNATPAFPSDK